MDRKLFCGRQIVRETPCVLDADILSQFGLAGLFKDKNKKKVGRALAVSFQEILEPATEVLPTEEGLAVKSDVRS